MSHQDKSSILLPPIFDRTRIIDAKQAAEALGFSVAHLRRLYRNGKLPKPIRIGGHKLGWPAGVIADVIEAAGRGNLS